jgi:hypothetical protein
LCCNIRVVTCGCLNGPKSTATFFICIVARELVLPKKPLFILSDIVTEAHVQVQRDFENINPVVSVNQKMRTHGIPADVMTIDCLKSGKRILLVLHDEQPDIVRYQFSFIEEDPGDKFETIPLSELTTKTLYDWIKNYFSSVTN